MLSRPARSFVLAGVVAVAGCAGSTATSSRAPAGAPLTPAASEAPATVDVVPAPSATSAVATTAPPVEFSSVLYGYSATLPADWHVGAAMLRWDGASSPGHDDGSVDKFASPSTLSAWGFAGPVTSDLDGFVADNIAWTVRDHGDTCPAMAPEATESIQIGGESGVLLAWNCGILINEALIVHDGMGFVFVMRDPEVAAATDASDRALFEDLLDSVRFPT